MISASTLGARLEGLLPIGRSESGTTRLPWTDELRQAEAWFGRQAAEVGLSVERDPAGNLWACPSGEGPWWGVGSHLDSVRNGGSYDGALGVAAAFEVARAAQAPVAVISLADEEGARFNTPTFGSRALAGRLDPAVLERLDADGVGLGEAMRRFGVDPGGVGSAPEWLARLRGFLELHIDQSRDVDRASEPFAVASALAARIRVRVECTGRADHAGTTPMDERADALAAAARLISAATAVSPPMRATATRIEAEPNALSTVPALARFWLDARAGDPREVDDWLARLHEAADAEPLPVRVEVQSRSDGVEFDTRLRAALAADGAPETVCFAGHDAGILAERIPAAMVLVRNPTGISHAPDEEVSLEDAAAAAQAIADAIEELQ